MGPESYSTNAERLDPRNAGLFTSARALPTSTPRRFPEVLRKLDQVLNITKDDPRLQEGEYCPTSKAIFRGLLHYCPLRPNADSTQVLETQVDQAILSGALSKSLCD